jgi:hypothetical protein
MKDEISQIRITEAAMAAGMEIYESSSGAEMVAGIVQAVLNETPTWVVEQYVTARRAEEE